MAKSLSKSNIVTNNTILASDVSQSIDALTGDVAYDIVISGSLETTGSVDISGLLTATSGITHQLTASNAVSASFASTATSASYADNVPAGGLPSGLLSSSAQIASDISGAFAAPSASFSTRVSTIEGNYATTGSNQFNGNQQITGSLIVSSSNVTFSDDLIFTGTENYINASQSLLRISASHLSHELGRYNMSVRGGNNATIDVYDGGIYEIDTNSAGGITLNSPKIGLTGPVTASGDVSGSSTSTASFGHFIGDGSQITNISSGALPSGLLSSSAQISSDISGAFGAPSASFSTRVSANESNISTNTTNITTLTSKTGSYATTGSNQFNGNQTVTGSLTVSGSDGILGNKLSIGEYGASGGSTSDELLISGSGLQRMSIESKDAAAGLRLKSPSSYNTFIDFEEGSDQRFIMGVLSTDDSFYLATGSALVSGSILKAVRSTGDIEITHNISASAVSASTYYGDGSNLTGISSDPFPYNGDVVITGSLTVGDNSANDFDIIVDGGSIEIKRQNNNILRDYTSPGFSSGGAVIFGYRALGSQQGQNQTVAIGRDAGFAQLNSDYAVFMGYAAGGSSGTGDADQSTMIGAEAGYNAKAAGNTFLGYRAGYDIASGTNNIIIGHYAASGSGDLSSQLRIGSGSLTAISASLNTGDIIFPSTASAAYFTGSFAGDGSNLTNVPSSVSDLNDLTDVKIVDGSTALANSIFIANGTSPGAAPQHGTLSNASRNLAIMAGSLASITGGDSNICIGFYAGNALTTQGGNVLIGDSAGKLITDANAKTTAIGYGALDAATTGTQNTAVGYNAGSAVTLGDFNTLLGSGAGDGLENADKNIIIGYEADGAANSDNQIAIGDQVVATGTGDIKIGDGDGEIPFSGSSVTGDVLFPNDVRIENDLEIDGTLLITGSGTVLPTIESSDGIAALKLKSGGSHAYIDMDEGADQRWIAGMYTNDNSYRIASGSAFSSNTLFELDQDGKIEIQSNLSSSATSTASFGTYIGDGSQLSGISSTPFPFVGDAVITGSLTISGSQAFVLDSSNVVLGQNAGGGTVDTGTDDGNVIIGKDAAGGGALNSGDNNIVIGHTAGYALSTGDNNIIIGFEAGKVNTATANTFIGSRSGQKNTTGYFNTFIGRDSGMECVEWQNNTYIGYAAGRNPRDEMNTAVGAEAMYGASGANTAEQNVAMGYRALYAIASNGDGNVAIGWKAGDSITSGTDNIAIGYDADVSATGTNQIAIGDGVTTTGDGDIRIGNGSSLLISGSSATGFLHDVKVDDLTVSGSITYPNASIVTYTNDPGSYTLTTDEHLVLIDAASGTVTITLPDAATYPGREIHFKVTTNPGGNTITLQRAGSDTIDGATSNTSLDTQYEAISVISDGSSQWFIF